MLEAIIARNPTEKTYIEDVFNTTLYTGTAVDQQIVNNITLGGEVGAASFTAPGTYTWVCPAGVTSVSVVCIGGGGSGPYGGPAGGLGYKNNISVTPGQSYTVVVGAGVARNTNGIFSSTSAGDSYFISDTIVKGGGAKYLGGSSFAGGTYTGDGGGNGGNVWTSASGFGSGAGAGGYSGNGGQGVGSTPAKGGNAGAGGGGGSGGIGVTSTSFYMGAGGGGTGIYGSGSSGAAGPAGTISSVPASGGGGGSGGETGASVDGNYSDGGKYGGGGGSGGGSGAGFNGAGGGGAVRIIWPGTTRQFPSTNVTNAPNTTPAGLVWIKGRSVATAHALYDTARGTTKDLVTSSTAAQTTQTTGLTSFNSDGFNIGSLSKLNTNGYTYVAWTFKKQAKFFDIVTWTGDNTTSRSLNHSLGVLPGLIIVKKTNSTGNWYVVCRYNSTLYGYGDTNTGVAQFVLNSTGYVQTTATFATTATISTVNIAKIVDDHTNNTGTYPTGFNHLETNASGDTYVAYLFAHDPSADGLIQCGNWNGSGEINLGWEPQFILTKKIGLASDWYIVDNMRKFTVAGQGDELLIPNKTDATLSSGGYASPTATGFTIEAHSDAIIYVAIRRGPMRRPTDATKVYSGSLITPAASSSVGFPPDLAIVKPKTSGQNNNWFDRMRGPLNYNASDGAGTETNAANSLTEFGQNGITTGSWYTGVGSTSVEHFRRAAGFFDIVCYTGTGSNDNKTHNLSVVPELIILKSRSSAIAWYVLGSDTLFGGSGRYLSLNSTAAYGTGATRQAWTASTFSVGSLGDFNGSGTTYVSYLFASCPGVSKVGTFTGNGAASQTIDCGFSNGARFIMIKRLDGVGDWYYWDSVRGIVAGNDPFLKFNSTGAEVTNSDDIDPTSVGFIANKDQTAGLNENGWQYIYLAIA